MLFFLDYLQITQKTVYLQCVFHSIRFKVNKGWSKALLLFLCLYFAKMKNTQYELVSVLSVFPCFCELNDSDVKNLIKDNPKTSFDSHLIPKYYFYFVRVLN